MFYERGNISAHPFQILKTQRNTNVLYYSTQIVKCIMQNMFDEVTLHRSQTINRHTQLKCKRELCMIELKNNKYYILTT